MENYSARTIKHPGNYTMNLLKNIFVQKIISELELLQIIQGSIDFSFHNTCWPIVI